MRVSNRRQKLLATRMRPAATSGMVCERETFRAPGRFRTLGKQPGTTAGRPSIDRSRENPSNPAPQRERRACKIVWVTERRTTVVPFSPLRTWPPALSACRNVSQLWEPKPRLHAGDPEDQLRL